MTNADPDVGNVPQGGVADPKKAPESGSTAGSVKTGSPAKTDTSPDKEKAELKAKIDKLEAMHASSQEMIGRLSDELGQHRQQTAQNIDMSAIGKSIQDALLDTEHPENALTALQSVIQAAKYHEHTNESARAKTYLDVVSRNPEFKDVTYGEVVLNIMANGGDPNNVNTKSAMEKTIRDIRAQRMGIRDFDAELNAKITEERQKWEAEMRASGSVPGGTGTDPPDPPKELTPEQKYIAVMARSMGIQPPVKGQ